MRGTGGLWVMPVAGLPLCITIVVSATVTGPCSSNIAVAATFHGLSGWEAGLSVGFWRCFGAGAP